MNSLAYLSGLISSHPVGPIITRLSQCVQVKMKLDILCLTCWLVGFLTSSSTTRLYRGRAPRQERLTNYELPHMRQSWETMTSVSAGHIILTPTQPVGSGRSQRGSNPGRPLQEARAPHGSEENKIISTVSA